MASSTVAFGQKGAIVTIRLRNFMTYTDTSFKPAGNLNMIIGPNGTGKSAIVCAIIVGLAGEVSLTGRANSITSLVKKGFDSGSTFIELWSGRPGRSNYTIERKITLYRCEGKLEHKSDWILNGRSATMKEVRKLTKELNIKVDNLCQFLPQDSVASFVKMSHNELLVNTLKAAGDNELVENLETLTELTKNISEQTYALDQLEKSSKENEVNARRLETEVERLREREKLQDKKKICGKKLAYYKYKEANVSLKLYNEQIRNMEAELKALEARGDPYKRDMDHNINENRRLAVELASCKSGLRETFKKVAQLSNHYKEVGKGVHEAYGKFKAKETEEKQRSNRLKEKQTQLRNYESRWVDLRTIHHGTAIQKLKGEVDALKRDMGSKQGLIRDLEHQRSNQVIQVESVRAEREGILKIKEKKLDLVRRKRPELYKVCDWLISHRDKFNEQVFVPMLCEINVKRPTDAAIVEHAISDNERWSFVCQTEHDLRYLTRAAREHLNVNINVILVPEKTIAEFEKEEKLPDFGTRTFRAYMKDLIDAPEPIMRVLYGLCNFHLLPVFTVDTQEHELKALMKTLKKFFVNNQCYQITKSRYDGEIMTATETVRSAQDLVVSLDAKKLEEKTKEMQRLIHQKRELDEKQKVLEAELDTCTNERSEKIRQLTDLSSKVEEKKRVEACLKNTRQEIADIETYKIDLSAERRKLHEAVQKVNHKMVDALRSLSSTTKDYANCVKTVSMNELLREKASKNYQVLRRQYARAMEASKRLKLEIADQLNHIRQYKRIVDDARASAEEKIATFRDGKLDKTTKKQFALIEQDTVDELELLYEELKQRIHGIIRDPCNSIILDYNRQNEELRDKRARITALKDSIVKLNTDREMIKRSFIPSLNTVIKDIDEHYQSFMRKLSYDGRVELEFDETKPDDFSEYGIRILVKYRDDERLIALTSTRQSGGERSVATMIYMLALQTQTTVPFRVVDEINQGMDKDNERKVFELLVQTAEESSSQYFLVSPKLLSNLEYGDKMQIHVIFNGPLLRADFNELLSQSATMDARSHVEMD